MTPVLAAAAALFLLVAILYFLLVTTEGAFLGRRIVVWLYDITATRYDGIKQYEPDDERILVLNPLVDAVSGVTRPRLLDVATGTGRVPVAIAPALPQATVVGLDDAQRMLSIAAAKLAPYAPRVTLVRHPAVPLPFADSSFDLVSCLEALEFFPSDRRALEEMVRVLRPGASLFVTRRRGWEGRAFLHRYRSADDMRALLQELGLEAVRIFHWEVNYDLVTARKPLRADDSA